MILPADKGCASVVLDMEIYHSKMSTLIKTGPFTLLKKDPTDRLSRKATEKLLQLERSGNLSETEYNNIRPKQKRPPRIYGVPKIHKANAPLRPMVSSVNTLAYNLSGHLAKILSPLTGNSNYTVKNSGEFANIISKETIPTDEAMISFDVESLFTNVPIEETVQAALHRLNNDPSLPDRTALTPTQIADLLNFVLRSTYLKYNGALYEQQEDDFRRNCRSIHGSLQRTNLSYSPRTTENMEALCRLHIHRHETAQHG